MISQYPNSQLVNTHLCTPFLYFFAFLSNMVYLSLGSISCSVGISAFHLSISLIVPCDRACSPSSCPLGTSTPCSVKSGTNSPCLGPRPCRRASCSAFPSLSNMRCPSAVEESSSTVALSWKLLSRASSLRDAAGNDEDTGAIEAACRFNALSRTATTLSTRRNRRRCRSFWGADSR